MKDTSYTYFVFVYLNIGVFEYVKVSQEKMRKMSLNNKEAMKLPPQMWVDKEKDIEECCALFIEEGCESCVVCDPR